MLPEHRWATAVAYKCNGKVQLHTLLLIIVVWLRSMCRPTTLSIMLAHLGQLLQSMPGSAWGQRSPTS